MSVNVPGNNTPTPMYRLVGRYFDGANVVAYKLVGLMDNKIYNVNRDTMMKASSRGLVQNARVQNYNGVDILRGVGININDTAKIDINQLRAQNQAKKQAQMAAARRQAAGQMQGRPVGR